MSVSTEVDIANLALQRLGQPVISTVTESSRDATIVNQLYDQNRDYCLMLADWDSLIHRQVMTRAGRVAITGVAASSPVAVTMTGHVFVANELVTIEDVVGTTELNDNRYRVYSYTSTAITLYDTSGDAVDGTGYTAWVSGGYAYRDPGSNWSYVYDVPSATLRVLGVLDADFGEDESYSWLHERGLLYCDVEEAGLKFIKKDTDPSLYESDLVELIATRLSWLIAMRIHADKELRNATYQEFQAILARGKLTNASGSASADESADRWTDAR